MKQLVIPIRITQRDYKSLDKYFNEVEKLRQITPTEEVQLAEKIRNGDKAALERLTKANLRFVISVAKRYQNMGLGLEDLINEGNIGLMIAAKRYDETKGFKFISYAVWWIRQSIIGALAEHSHTIRLPHNRLTLMTKTYKASVMLEQEYRRKPTTDELGEYIGMPSYKVSELLTQTEMTMSLYEPFANNEEFSPIEVLPHSDKSPDDKLIFESIKAEIDYSMRVLSRREREILILYFGLSERPPLMLDEIGRHFDITKEHVGRIKESALKKLRNCTSASVLKSCMGHLLV